MENSSAVKQLITNRQSLFLSTIDQQGQPFASYTPYASCFSNKALYILVSDLSLHGLHLLNHSQASVLITEDEAETQQIYARQRLQYQVTAKYINTDPDKSTALNLLTQKHGEIIDLLSTLTDFRLFQLTPKHGRYVQGFGKTYCIADHSLYDDMKAITPDDLKSQ